MQISTTKAVLAPQLALVSGAADTRGVVPALSHVLLKATDKGDLALVCSDTGLLARAVSTVQVKEGGEIAVDVTRLHALVRAVPDEQAIELSTESDKKTLLVKSGRSRFRLPTIAASDYPRLTPAKEERIAITMGGRRLAEMISDVASSMGDADIRPFLNGALFALDARGLWLVSTDGCRLTVAHEPIPGGDTMVPRNIIVPRKTVLLAKKLLAQGGNVTVTFGATNIQFQFEDSTLLFGQAIDGKFPSYESVVPSTQFKMTASADRLANALSMLSVTPDTKASTSLKNKMELTIDTTTATLQRGDDGLCEIECESDAPKPLEFAFNLCYLTDAIATIRASSDAVQIGFNGSNTQAITLRPTSQPYPLCVVMPLKG